MSPQQDKAQRGTVYLLPCPLHEGALFTIPSYTREAALRLEHFFVENERSARRYLKLLDPAIVIDRLHFYLVNENHAPDLAMAKKLMTDGKDIGIISEAGCPAIADPGSAVVALAHQTGSRVVPLTGPNSILLALMASGMNGQNYQFHGYLPVKPLERIRKIRELEGLALQKKQTQIFIEAPYRNNQLVSDIVAHCREQTLLCIAADLSAPTEFIATRPVREWKKNLPELHKRPAIFLLGSA